MKMSKKTLNKTSVFIIVLIAFVTIGLFSVNNKLKEKEK